MLALNKCATVTPNDDLTRIQDDHIGTRYPFRPLEHSRKHHCSNHQRQAWDTCIPDAGTDLIFVFVP
jgi:hypothetical protein